MLGSWNARLGNDVAGMLCFEWWSIFDCWNAGSGIALGILHWHAVPGTLGNSSRMHYRHKADRRNTTLELSIDGADLLEFLIQSIRTHVTAHGFWAVVRFDRHALHCRRHYQDAWPGLLRNLSFFFNPLYVLSLDGRDVSRSALAICGKSLEKRTASGNASC